MRFDDDQTYLEEFLDEVWVRCPRCSATGIVEATAPYSQSTPRFTCSGCALRLEGRHSRWFDARPSEPHDPSFGLPLLLQAPCKGETLWAFNPRHLSFIAGYVAATIRERTPNYNASLASRLPDWIKVAKNRTAVLRAVRQIESDSLS